MNREELEKIFDEEFNPDLYIDDGFGSFDIADEVKAYIFETIIPEVLKSIIPNSYIKARNEYSEMFFTSKEILEIIKQKAKELYNIDL